MTKESTETIEVSQNTINIILQSEFFWGIVVGLILAAIGAVIQVWLSLKSQKSQQKESILTLSGDVLKNIVSILEEFEEVRRKKNRFIDVSYLVLLDVEIAILSRNRELMILVEADLRQDIRDYLVKIALKRTEIGNLLNQFYREGDAAAAKGQDPMTKNALEKLEEAAQRSIELYDFKAEGEELLSRINP